VRLPCHSRSQARNSKIRVCSEEDSSEWLQSASAFCPDGLTASHLPQLRYEDLRSKPRASARIRWLRRALVKTAQIATVAGLVAFSGLMSFPAMAAVPGPSHEGGTSLFNGKNFDRWYTWLAQSGKNNDPKHIFKVEHGMIHIYAIPASSNPQEFGYLATNQDLSHCRIRAEYKCGGQRFVPRAMSKRDSGMNYYRVGPDNFLSRALEMQVSETNTGDLWMNGGISATTSLESENPSGVPGEPWLYSLACLMHENGSVLGGKALRRSFSDEIDAPARAMTTVWT
jgi:hypothetical protein